jgi:hypothetical protein
MNNHNARVALIRLRHLLPRRRARAKALNILAFPRLLLQMGEGARRADEGSLQRVLP